MFAVDKFMFVHHNSYVMMTQGADNMDYQLTNRLTHVNFLLNAIECKDDGLSSSITMVNEEKLSTRKKN